MGFVVLHMEKAHGSDSGTTAHIERFIIPKNADPTRTHLNRKLVTYPDGIKDRTAAIQKRLEEAGLTRKIGNNQVRAIRINVSGTHEDMKRIEKEGRLDEWCADNMKYFADLFGRENIVAAHLHRDEETPHIHITLVPIVKGERKRKKREEQVKKRYRKKPNNAVRLCADDIMTRLKLKSYQDSYAVAMAKYGLQRGIDGSQARHKSTQQYYRDIQKLADSLKSEVVDLQEQKTEAEQELRRAKKEVQTEKLKGAATTAVTNIAESVGSLFGSGKLKDLEQANENLRHEIAKRDKGIDELKAKMQQMQEQHGKQIRNLQGIHNQELETKDKEISRLNTILEKAFNWFPLLKEMLRMEKLCYTIGFTKDMVNSLLAKKEAIRCNGKIYSEEHKRRFEIKNDIFKIEKSSVDENKLVLTINRQPIGEWFKEQWEKLRHGLRQSAEEPRKSRGFRM